MKLDLTSVRTPAGDDASGGSGSPFRPQVGVLPSRSEVPSLEGLPYTVLDFGSMSDTPRVPSLVEGILAERSVGAVYGLAGVGKSFFNIHLAFCIACGIPWMGRKTVQGPVLYVVAEGEGEMGDRINAWMDAYGVSGSPPVYFLTDNPQLHREQDAKKLLAVAERIKPVLIIIDPLAQCMVGVDELKVKEMSPIMDVAKQLAKIVECSVLLTHHTGRKGIDPRGSSAIEAGVDTAMLLSKDGKDGIQLISKKVKYYRSFDTIRMGLHTHAGTLVVGTPSGAKADDSASGLHRDTIEGLKCLEESGGRAKSKQWQALWINRTSKSAGSFSTMRASLVAAGAVTKGVGLQDPYQITESGSRLIHLTPNNQPISNNVEEFQSYNPTTPPKGVVELNESNDDTRANPDADMTDTSPAPQESDDSSLGGANDDE